MASKSDPSRSEPMLSYPKLLPHLDAQIESLLPNQITGETHPDRGGFVNASDGMPGGSHFGCVQALGFGWLCEGSRYYGDPDIHRRLLLAAAFARHIRRPSGRFDLITTNWDCGPYTAEIDIEDYCQAGCTLAYGTSQDGGTSIDANQTTGALETLKLNSGLNTTVWQSPLAEITVEGLEGFVCEIRLQ